MGSDREDPIDDGMRDRKNRGRRPRRVYSRYSRLQAATDLLTAYKWPLVLAIIAVSIGIWWQDVGLSDVPVEVWSLLFYLGVGAFPGGVLAYVLVRWLSDIRGVELLDFDPVTDSHRHFRVGHKLWDDVEVRTPWGETTDESDLRRCSINGRQGFEVMDFRIEDGKPTCVATWMGEASGAEIRTFKSAYRYAHKRLARRADRATMIRANQGEIAREAAEKVVLHMIQTAEQARIPNGEQIETVVSDVLSDHGLNDPLDDDLKDDRIPDVEDDRADRDDRPAGRGADRGDGPQVNPRRNGGGRT